jgi:hypothetical protein
VGTQYGPGREGVTVARDPETIQREIEKALIGVGVLVALAVLRKMFR